MIKGIITGFKTYSTSFGLVTKLKLWKYFAIPILISLLTAIIIGLCVYSFSDNIGHWIEQIWPWEWGKKGFFIFAEILSAIFIITIGFILYKHIVMALSAPFMGPVSEKIEIHLLGKSHEQKENNFRVQLWRGIRINVRNLSMELLLTIPILLFGLIPVIGFIATILLFLMQAYYAGFGNMDYTLERYFNYNKSIKFVRKHKGEAIGNGIVFMLFLLIPIVGVILVLPLSVTAATVQTIELLDIKKK